MTAMTDADQAGHVVADPDDLTTVSPAAPRRWLLSAAADAFIVIILANLPVFLVLRILRHGRESRFAMSDGLLVLWVLLAITVAVHLRRQTVKDRGFTGIPRVLRRFSRRIVEVSTFGVGSLKHWTIANPEVGLDRIVRPLSIEELDLHNESNGSTYTDGFGSVAGAPGRHNRSEGGATARPVEASATLAISATGEYVVERGDTFWSLAERALGDGKRWVDLRDLNLDREVQPGTRLAASDTLRSGWTILLPTATESRSSLDS